VVFVHNDGEYLGLGVWSREPDDFLRSRVLVRVVEQLARIGSRIEAAVLSQFNLKIDGPPARVLVNLVGKYLSPAPRATDQAEVVCKRYIFFCTPSFSE
jgi:hypothetical protein